MLLRQLPLLLCSLAWPLAARASVVEQLPLAELTHRADRVVVGQVLETQTAWSDDHRHVFRRVSVRVDQTLKGGASEGLVLLLRGGTLDGISETVVGVPSFEAGERVLLFVRQQGEVCRLVGLGQGAFAIDTDGTAAQKLDGLSLASAGTDGALGLSIHGEGGVGRRPLSALRALIEEAGQVTGQVTGGAR